MLTYLMINLLRFQNRQFVILTNVYVSNIRFPLSAGTRRFHYVVNT